MSYSWDKIGKRIKEERKKMPSKLPKTGKRKAGYVTQQELAEMICKEMGLEDTDTYRKKVGKWEAGKPVDQKELLILCDIFRCDIHYLLCETDTRYYTDMKDVEKYGLTPEALSTLREMAIDGWQGFKLDMISALIQNRYLIDSLTDLWLSTHAKALAEQFYSNNKAFLDSPPEWEEFAHFDSGVRKQKEFELYRTLVDFIEGK